MVSVTPNKAEKFALRAAALRFTCRAVRTILSLHSLNRDMLHDSSHLATIAAAYAYPFAAHPCDTRRAVYSRYVF